MHTPDDQSRQTAATALARALRFQPAIPSTTRLISAIASVTGSQPSSPSGGESRDVSSPNASVRDQAGAQRPHRRA